MKQPRFLRSLFGGARKSVMLLLLAAGLLTTYTEVNAQSTIVIDSVTNNGGFESGSTGWTIVNGSQVNKWQVGTTATAGFSQAQAAFISQSTVAPFAHDYDINTGSVVHFYQDVTLPAYEPGVTLSFNIICEGEGTTTLFDYLNVYLAPTTVTPIAGIDLGATYQVGPSYNLLGTNWITVNITIPQSLAGNAAAPSTRRLIFQWVNDFSVGAMPPAGIDNIKLVTNCGVATTPATLITPTTATLNWGAYPGATNYEVRYKKVSDPATVATWATPTIVAAPATSLAVMSLAPNQVPYEYQVFVTGLCPNWSASETFLTDCSPIVGTYTETFEGLTADNTFPPCMTVTSPGNGVGSSITSSQNHTPGGDKVAYFTTWGPNNAIITPPLSLTAGRTYRFSYWYITDGNPGWTSMDAFFGTSPTISGLTGFIGSVPYPDNTVYKQYSSTFVAPTTGVYYVGIVNNNNGNAWELTVDDLELVELPPCTGTPVAGTITPISVCPNENFQLEVTGGASSLVTAGITYQWQDSTATGWQNSAGPSATQATYLGSITVPTNYRLIVSCANSGQSDTTDAFTVQIHSFLYCYCQPTYSSAGTTDNITEVTLSNLVNNTASVTNAPPGYTDYSSQQPSPLAIPLLTMGAQDTVFVSFGSDGNQYSAIWLDFNQDGVFSSNEYYTSGANAGSGGTIAIPFVTPLTAKPGLTKLRVRGGDDAQPNNSQACGPSNSTWGESEDYLVNIKYPPCTGPLNAGTVVSSETAMCVGYTFDLIDTTHEYHYSQISWIWENSNDGGLSWFPVANSANKDMLNNILFTGNTSYRLKMICEATGDSSYSNTMTITVKAPYACYCYSQSNGGVTDTSDIGAVVIGTMVNSTGGPHILNPVAIRKRTDYTDIPNIVMNANGTYRLSIFHTQNNKFHADARVSVFIDYNNDLVYDVNATPNSELVFSGISTEANFYIDTVVRIPNAVVGNVPTGLRVILNNDLNPQSPANLGCGPYVSGETEDYVIMFRRTPQHVGGVNNIEQVALYPNPTNGRFTIAADATIDMKSVEVMVTTITGQPVLKKQYAAIGKDFKENLDLSEVAKGIYFVTLQTAAGDKIIKKLVIR